MDYIKKYNTEFVNMIRLRIKKRNCHSVNYEKSFINTTNIQLSNHSHTFYCIINK